MSLINNMLKGLERQRAESPEERDYSVLEELSAVDYQELTSRRRGPPIGIGLSLFLIVLVAGTFSYAVMFKKDDPSPKSEFAQVDEVTQVSAYAGKPVDTKPEKEQVDVPASSADTSTVNKNLLLKMDATLEMLPLDNDAPLKWRERTVAVTDIRLNEEHEALKLGLSLADETKYLIYTLQNPNRAVIELADAKYEGVLPDVNDLQGINAIRQRRMDDGTYKLVLESDHEILIESSALDTASDGYMLLVEMLNESGVASTSNTEDPDPPISRVGTFTKSPAGDKLAAPALVKGISEASSQTDVLIYEGRKLYQEGRVKQGLEKIAEAVQREPEHVRARTTLAVLLLEQGKNAMAKKVLAEGLSVKPDQSEWAKVLGRALYSEDRLEQAKTVLESASPPLSDDPDYHALYAGVLQAVEDHARAAIVYRNLLKYGGDNGTWWLGLAMSLEAMARDNDAIVAYRNALNAPEMNPDSAEFIKRRLQSLEQQSS